MIMKPVRELPSEVSSLVRSGVIIPTPSQAVVELVLNSIDAEASSVAVRVDLRLFKIQVIDNGHGISLSDLQAIGNRSVTNKCYTLDEFYNNLTYHGYRGESLASLREMCGLLEIVTYAVDGDNTYSKLFIHGKAEKVKISDLKRPAHGTTVTITDFMFNMPIRRDRLKEAVELEAIRSCIECIALAHPEISLSVRNDVKGRIILEKHKSSDLLSAFEHLFGHNLARTLAPVEFSTEKFQINGYISKEAYRHNDLQFIYVNRQPIMKTKLHKLITVLLAKSSIIRTNGPWKSKPIPKHVPVERWLSFPSLEKQKKFSVFVVNITCARKEYEMSWDSKKPLIYFRDWEGILSCISNAVQTFLKLENLVEEEEEDDERKEQQEMSKRETNEKEIRNCSVIPDSHYKKTFEATCALPPQGNFSDHNQQIQYEVETWNIQGAVHGFCAKRPRERTKIKTDVSEENTGKKIIPSGIDRRYFSTPESDKSTKKSELSELDSVPPVVKFLKKYESAESLQITKGAYHLKRMEKEEIKNSKLSEKLEKFKLLSKPKLNSMKCHRNIHESKLTTIKSHRNKLTSMKEKTKDQSPLKMCVEDTEKEKRIFIEKPKEHPILNSNKSSKEEQDKIFREQSFITDCNKSINESACELDSVPPVVNFFRKYESTESLQITKGAYHLKRMEKEEIKNSKLAEKLQKFKLPCKPKLNGVKCHRNIHESKFSTIKPHENKLNAMGRKIKYQIPSKQCVEDAEEEKNMFYKRANEHLGMTSNQLSSHREEKDEISSEEYFTFDSDENIKQSVLGEVESLPREKFSRKCDLAENFQITNDTHCFKRKREEENKLKFREGGEKMKNSNQLSSQEKLYMWNTESHDKNHSMNLAQSKSDGVSEEVDSREGVPNMPTFSSSSNNFGKEKHNFQFIRSLSSITDEQVVLSSGKNPFGYAVCEGKPKTYPSNSLDFLNETDTKTSEKLFDFVRVPSSSRKRSRNVINNDSKINVLKYGVWKSHTYDSKETNKKDLTLLVSSKPDVNLEFSEMMMMSIFTPTSSVTPPQLMDISDCPTITLEKNHVDVTANSRNCFLPFKNAQSFQDMFDLCKKNNHHNLQSNISELFLDDSGKSNSKNKILPQKTIKIIRENKDAECSFEMPLTYKTPLQKVKNFNNVFEIFENQFSKKNVAVCKSPYFNFDKKLLPFKKTSNLSNGELKNLSNESENVENVSFVQKHVTGKDDIGLLSIFEEPITSQGELDPVFIDDRKKNIVKESLVEPSFNFSFSIQCPVKKSIEGIDINEKSTLSKFSSDFCEAETSNFRSPVFSSHDHEENFNHETDVSKRRLLSQNEKTEELFKKNECVNGNTHDYETKLKSSSPCVQSNSDLEKGELNNKIEGDSHNENMEKDWLQLKNFEGKLFYFHVPSGLTSFNAPSNPKDAKLYTMSKRSEFLPKGMSPILTATSSCHSISKQHTDHTKTSSDVIDWSAHSQDHIDLRTVKWREKSGIAYKGILDMLDISKDKKILSSNTTIPDLSFISAKMSGLLLQQKFDKRIFTNLQVIGQLDNKFIVTLCSLDKHSSPHILGMFDQHAVHERIRLETLMKEYSNNENDYSFKATELSETIVLAVRAKEFHIMSSFSEKFEKLGLTFSIREKENVAIHKIPTCLYNRFLRERSYDWLKGILHIFIQDIVQFLLKTGGQDVVVPEVFKDVINSEACKGAIKFGDPLSISQCEDLLLFLSKCNLPFYCAHGRPSFMPIFDLRQFEIERKKYVSY